MWSFSSDVSFISPPRGIWLLIGIGAILAADIATVLSIAFLYLLGFQGSDWVASLLPASLAGLLAGWFFWGLFILRPKHATVGRGIVFGALSSICAHPLMMVFLDPARILYGTNFFELPQFFLHLAVDFGYSLFSLVYVGWITTIVGGVAGGLLVFLQCVLTQRLREQHEL